MFLHMRAKLTSCGLAAARFVFGLGMFMPWGPHALAASPQGQLQSCLQKAKAMPDIAAAEAEAWHKEGGGDDALLCEAYAQFGRGEFDKAAHDFVELARKRHKDRTSEAMLYDQAGLAFARAHEAKEAEKEFAAALRIEPDIPDIWLDRADERADDGRYWDAISDIDRALKIMPDMPGALRMRGRACFKLGLDSNARADFAKAAAIEKEDKALLEKARTRKKP